MSNLSTPTADQLAAARLAHWRHNADPILTINMLRDWLNTSGLVLFTPRAAQLPAPAPSFVEAILGEPNATPALADTEQSRSLLSRLILDGGAIPLNLLGNPTGIGTETPDFIVSPLAFPYIFTLRGDKAWKQPPTTTGATKVSTLALNAYTLLSERAKDAEPGLSASALATQLGKEVTETAVLRALTELWQHLRVLPVPQSDGAATLWELTTTRFTKQIKAGANAGQPTALSALISLYLGQAIVASEEEIETFLSPIAARSRIRDVIHALLSARQLETVAVEGRTVLHVTGELPAFLAPAAPAPDDIDSIVVTTEGDTPQTAEQTAEEAPARIKKFIPKPRKVGTGFVTRTGHNVESRATPRERRPFTRESNRPDRPSFTKPWAEEKADRLAAAQSPSNLTEGEAATPATPPSRTYDRKPTFDRPDREGKRPPFGSRPSFGNKPSFGSKPRFNDDRTSSGRPAFDRTSSGRPSYDRTSSSKDRPAFRRNEASSDTRPPRRDFAPRPYNDRSASDSTGDRPRKTFSKPGTFTRKREGFAGKSSFSRDNDSRPPRRDFAPRSDSDSRDSRPPRREFTARADRDSSDSRPPRRTFGDKPGSPPFSGPRTPGSFSPRPPRNFEGSERPKDFAPRKTFTRSEGQAGRTSRSDGPPFRKFDAPRSPRPVRARDDPDTKPGGSFGEKKPYSKPGSGFGTKKPYGKSGGGFAAKSGSSFPKKSGSFAGKKPYGKSAATGTGKPASTFDKFKGNKKPFGKRAPTRKFKPE